VNLLDQVEAAQFEGSGERGLLSWTNLAKSKPEGSMPEALISDF
jgi:hypothetical protein